MSIRKDLGIGLFLHNRIGSCYRVTLLTWMLHGKTPTARGLTCVILRLIV